MTILIINPNSTASMTEAMLDAARRAAPDMAFDAWTSHDGPPAIQGREDGVMATLPLIELLDKAADAQATGVIIGCFDDTALAEARSRVSCPVVGLGQAAYFQCALRGWRFSVVTTLPISVPVLEENIRTYGLSPYVGRVRASAIPVLELESSPAASVTRILEEVRAAETEDDIDAIVLGCAGMVTITDSLRANLALPVVDPIEAAVGAMRWLVRQSGRSD
ncbi:aspartate/glutamate racemase family protein [Ovoidimarina sediminis]|uniref:aspartate/glutamate racemase family protein n=1 Tax=Ovoidimarina sediminis TaxID=3079856 RepID=UPI00290C404E|nr:aspartate/glutamate racemase family protein [Rhodophyticola sp. MJ-SS7]MDU8946497.1 aspartate/glutamate racemase family protein [Rhodophyticola sp. MJ-SS7]